jgi:hypothetical protein
MQLAYLIVMEQRLQSGLFQSDELLACTRLFGLSSIKYILNFIFDEKNGIFGCSVFLDEGMRNEFVRNRLLLSFLQFLQAPKNFTAKKTINFNAKIFKPSSDK